MKKEFREFEDARKFVHSLKLKNQKEWYRYTKSKNFPKDIPKGVYEVYKNKGWTSMGDFLGTGVVADRYRKFRDFKDARKFIHSLKLKNQKQWIHYTKSKNFPNDLPVAPWNSYKNNGWITLMDWLGTKNIANRTVVWQDFSTSRKFVHKLKIENVRLWREYCKSGDKPDDIPKSPRHAYKKEWISWMDWLGVKYAPTQKRTYRSFDQAKKFVHKLGLQSTGDWKQYCKSGNKPNNIPSAPDKKYVKNWIDWSDWLGHGDITKSRKQWRAFEDAREFVRSLKLKNQLEWNNYYKSDKRPLDIPATPERAYKKDWKGLGDWIGTGTVATQDRNYLSMNEARKFVKSLGLQNRQDWNDAVKSGKIPKNIPHNPWHVYRKKK